MPCQGLLQVPTGPPALQAHTSPASAFIVRHSYHDSQLQRRVQCQRGQPPPPLLRHRNRLRRKGEMTR
jgi:hypothetical protein